jgi:hypothetical protein
MYSLIYSRFFSLTSRTFFFCVIVERSLRQVSRGTQTGESCLTRSYIVSSLKRKKKKKLNLQQRTSWHTLKCGWNIFVSKKFHRKHNFEFQPLVYVCSRTKDIQRNQQTKLKRNFKYAWRNILYFSYRWHHEDIDQSVNSNFYLT